MNQPTGRIGPNECTPVWPGRSRRADVEQQKQRDQKRLFVSLIHFSAWPMPVLAGRSPGRLASTSQARRTIMTAVEPSSATPPPPVSNKQVRAEARAAKAARKAQRPWLVRHWLLSSLGVIVLIIIVAGAASSGGASKAPITGQQASKAPSSTGASSSAPRSDVASVGQTLSITGNDGLKATVTVVSLHGYTTPHDTTIGEAPANGSYQVADVSIKVNSGQYDFNPLYFKYQAANDQTYNAFDGHAMTAGFQPMLDAGTLNPGQTTRGYVVLDVPAGGKDIQLTDPLGSVIGQWNLH
jgi:hypothetical protein